MRHIPHRRSSGKGPRKRLNQKVFSYFTDAEKLQLLKACEIAELSLSSFVAKAAKAEADKLLSEAALVAATGPLSADDIKACVAAQLPESRIIERIRRNGIRFRMTNDVEASFRAIGASAEILYEILRSAQEKVS